MTLRIRRWSHAIGVTITSWTLVFAQTSGTNWGKWGANDELGTLNYITPEVVRNATRLVKKSIVYSLSLPVAADQPSSNRRLLRHTISTGQGSGSRPFYPEDWLSLPTHGTTHWDGLAHVFGEGKMYNGYDARAYITPLGALKNGIEHASNKIITRGVLVDIARYKGVNRLAPGYVITVADVEEAARKQGVSFREGDVVLLRTGWLSMFYELAKSLPGGVNSIYEPDSKEGKIFLAGEPGIGWEVSQWLKKQRSAAVAIDNLFLEALPCEPEAARKIGHPGFDKPINYELIRNQGMTLGKLFRLDELAEACAADGVYEFLFIAPPMKLTHATGSPTNPLAIK